MRSRPHLVIDGALRAAQAVGASSVYFYVSDAAAAVSLHAAIAELDTAAAELHVCQVEPSYVAGEETAAVNAINGRPAKPSEKPPRPFQEGVRRLPTLVSNAETMACWPAIGSGTADQAPSFRLTLGRRGATAGPVPGAVRDPARRGHRGPRRASRASPGT